MEGLRVTGSITLHEDELDEQFVRASGPGGQNVNKVATAVRLRFDVRGARTLPERVKTKILHSGDSRLTKDGVLVLFAERHRTQEMNRKDARDRLVEIIRKAAHVPKHRVATKPSKAAKRRRVDAKTKRGAVKKMRSGKVNLD